MAAAVLEDLELAEESATVCGQNALMGLAEVSAGLPWSGAWMLGDGLANVDVEGAVVGEEKFDLIMFKACRCRSGDGEISEQS